MKNFHLNYFFSQLIAVRLGDLELAISHFETVLEEDGDNVNAIQNIAHSYGRLNKRELAEKWNAKVGQPNILFIYAVEGSAQKRSILFRLIDSDFATLFTLVRSQFLNTFSPLSMTVSPKILV